MGWVSLSTSKMGLVARKAELEGELMKISHKKNKLSNSSKTQKRIANKTHTRDMMKFEHASKSALDGIWDEDGNGVKDYFDTINTYTDPTTGQSYNVGSDFNQTAYDTLLSKSTDDEIGYALQKAQMQEEYEDEAAAVEEEVNRQETELQLEQEQIQTELQNINAQIQSYDQAVSADIQSSVVKFTA